MVKKIALRILIALLILSGLSYGIYSYRQNLAITTLVEEKEEFAVKRGDIRISFLADGKAQLPILGLRFPTSGQLASLNFNVGDNIKKGDVIATLEDTDYLNKIESAKINLDYALAKLNKTNQSYELQMISEKSKLYSLKLQFDNAGQQYLPFISDTIIYTAQEIEFKRISYENAKSAYEAAEKSYDILSKGSSDIRLDEISVEQAKVSLKTAQDNLQSTILRSLADGQLLYVSHRVGEEISPSVDFALLGLAENPTISAQVSEIDLTKIEKGQKVYIEFEALQDQVFDGKVLSIESLPIKDSAGLVNFNINVSIDNYNEKIKSDMTSTVSFVLKEKLNVLTIPNSAVKRIEGKQAVEMKDSNGETIIRYLKTGLTDGKNVEVIEGLDESEKVLIIKKK